MRFIRLIENNEWEGETWAQWIQYDGNETAVQQLADALATANSGDEEAGEESPFEIGYLDDPVAEDTVDLIVRYGNISDGGYMQQHSKVIGTLTFTDEHLAEIRIGEFDCIYKGQISDLMRPAEPAA